MHILFTRFPLESAYGGAEVQTLSLMKELRERGYDVSFLGSCPALLDLCRRADIPYSECEIGPPPVTRWDAFSFAWRRKNMRKTLLEALNLCGTIDAICMLSLSEKLLITEWAASEKKRVVWIEHDRVGRWLQWNPWLGTLRRLSRKVCTVTVSELSRQIYLKLGWPEDHTVAIPNGIDLKRLQKHEKYERAHDGMLRLGCVARLSEDKGVDLLIEAVRRLPNVTLDIVGEGSEEKRLLGMMGEMGNAEAHTTDFGKYADASRVRFFPHADHIGDFYLAHDVIILPSREHDPFGLAPAEAMMLGIPVIVTDACGIAGYLKNEEDAIIVTANSADALVEGIRRLVDKKTRVRIGKAGKKTAQEKFTIKKMTDEYEKQVLANRGQNPSTRLRTGARSR